MGDITQNNSGVDNYLKNRNNLAGKIKNKIVISPDEYLVEGALLRCNQGSLTSALEIPGNRDVNSEGKKKANCKDCTGNINVYYFGKCRRNTKNNICLGYMSLDSEWINTKINLFDGEKINGDNAINLYSLLICKKGGIILPVTSGQGNYKDENAIDYYKRSNLLLSWAYGNIPQWVLYGADPVNLCTGNFVYEKEDISISGKVELSFKRFYNSIGIPEKSDADHAMGRGWRHNYELKLVDVEHGVKKVCLGDGREMIFRKDISGSFYPWPGGTEQLEVQEGMYVFSDYTRYKTYFDMEGKPLYQRDPNDYRIMFSHDREGKLEAVYSSIGSSMHFIYNASGRLIKVMDHTGRSIALRYRYGALCEVTNPSDNTYRYEYDESGYLNRIITPRGICGLQNSYDGIGRAVEQVMPDGEVIRMQYDGDTGRSWVLERDGSLSETVCDDRLRHTKTVDADGEERYAYNDRNQKILWKDKNGNETHFAYDADGNLSRIETAEKDVFQFVYDQNHRMVQAKGPNGQRDLYAYDRAGNLAEITDSQGCTTHIFRQAHGLPYQVEWPDQSREHFSYDERDNLSEWIESTGSAHTFTYDACNRIASHTDGNGNHTEYAWDQMNRLVKVTNAAGDERQYLYNPSGMLEKLVDYDAGFLEWSYDDCNRISKIRDKEGNLWDCKYDTMGRIREIGYPGGNHVQYTYNRAGKIVCVKNAAGGEYHYTYDANGNLISERDENGRESRYTYDVMNRLAAVEPAGGGSADYTYNIYGKISRIRDVEGNELNWEYDTEGRVVREKRRDGTEMACTYHCMGGVETKTDHLGRRTVYEYGPGGRLTGVLYPGGKKETLEYDNAGNLIGRTGSDGQSVRYGYDALNRITSVESSLQKRIWFTYDRTGNIVKVSDSEGKIIGYEYSPGGRLTGMQDAFGNGLRYTYDALGEVTQVCQFMRDGDAEFCLSYERDMAGRMVSVTDGAGYRERDGYDQGGRVVEKTDRHGYTTGYQFSESGDVSQVQYGDGRCADYTYDLLHRLVKVRDWNGETVIERDRKGRILAITDYAGRRTSYSYGARGERTGMIYPDGTVITYQYDERMRLALVSTGNYRVKYRYDRLGRLCRKEFPEGLYAEYHYSAQGLPDGLLYRDAWDTYEKVSCVYDANGNKIRIERYRKGRPDACGTYQYTYDKLNRLTEVRKDGTMQERYGYDGRGNRIRKEADGVETCYTYNALNQLIRREEKGETGRITEYRYDCRGNLTEERWENGARQYVFGADNRLESMRLLEGKKETASVQYTYNGLGQRISRCVCKEGKTEVTEYILDLTRKYNNLIQMEVDGRTTDFMLDQHVLGQIGDGRFQTCLTDDMGSILRLLWLNGKTAALYGYGSFGEDLYGNQGEKQPFGYTGYRFDSITGTYYAGAREYQAENGRFISSDKIGYVNPVNHMSFNLYSYCMNNPVNYVDRMGNDIYYFYDPTMFLGLSKFQSKTDAINITNEFEIDIDDIHLIPILNKYSFIKEWNKMSDDSIDAVIIYCHAGPGAFQFGRSDNENYKKFHAKNYYSLNANMAEKKIEKKNIEVLVSLGCNTGNNLAINNNPIYREQDSKWMVELLLDDLGVKNVIAANGEIYHYSILFNHVMSVEDYAFTMNDSLPELRFTTTFNYYYKNENDKICSKYMAKMYNNTAEIFRAYNYLKYNSIETM